jgi:CRISPR-associated protein Csm1
MDDPLMQQSCRVALAAYLHDLGKFAERAGAFDGDPRLDAHLTLYCPMRRAGENRWFTHRHAAHTALAFDLIEKHLPDLLGGDPSPFVGRVRAEDTEDVEATDSLINAAAAHHKPDTFLQWVIATADRVASGFEREEFEQYNASKDETREGLNHFTARLLTLFEQARIGGQASSDRALRFRYPLKPLAPRIIFPVEANGYESRERERAKREYARLWDEFVTGLEAIPRSHRSNWPLWLDHFDSLWLAFTHAIPAATAFNIKPEVSLYDHSRATAALAVALWRWHSARGQTDSAAALAMRDRTDYTEPKLLLIQGDFFGIQNFLFASGGETRQQAAKLLRGRSFQVSLFTELAALRLLDELALPPTSQVLNAAGKFLIVAPNTDEIRRVLNTVRGEFDAWFLGHTFGMAGMGVAWEQASCNDFLKGRPGQPSPYSNLLERLHQSLERAKYRRFELCARAAPPLPGSFPYGVCEYNGRLPADREQSNDDVASCALSRDQVLIGEALARANLDRLLVLGDEAAQELHQRRDLRLLEVNIFDYVLAFTASEDASGKFGELAREQTLRRCWDFSAAQSDDVTGEQSLWTGYGRRFISGYVPRASAEDLMTLRDRYPDDVEVPAENELKTFDMLACEDRELNREGNWLGIRALGVLKGDIDNLGELFRVGLGNPTFAKTAALSRQVNGFFAIYLPWLLSREFTSIYTVFAGGDDFFLIGPWRTVQKLAARMRDDFAGYVAQNPEIHFSAGIVAEKPGAPVGALADLAEAALDAAKEWPDKEQPKKNAVTCFGETVDWSDWPKLEHALSTLNALIDEADLSAGYVYRLLQFVDLRREEEQKCTPEAAIWRARLKYATRRFVVDKKRGLDETGRQRLFLQIVEPIASAIETLGAAYRVALFNHLYRMRDH